MEYSSDDVDIVARTAWGEARGEGIIGMLAVIWVIYNRTQRAQWPDLPAAVARQDRQFSVWNQGNPNRIDIEHVSRNDVLYDAALGMAKAVFEGLAGEDPTGDADHYFATYIDMPWWAEDMTRTAEIGKHSFFRS